MRWSLTSCTINVALDAWHSLSPPPPPPPPPYVVVVVVCFVFDFFFSCCVWFLVVVIQLKTVCLSAVTSNNLLRSTFSKEQEQSMKIQWTLSGHQNSGHFLWEVINVDLEWTRSKYISLGYSRTDADSERLPSTTTACHLFIRKLPVHMLALPLIPYNYSAGICVAGDWFTLWNAFTKSIIRMPVCLLPSMFSASSSTSSRRCISQNVFWCSVCF